MSIRLGIDLFVRYRNRVSIYQDVPTRNIAQHFDRQGLKTIEPNTSYHNITNEQ